MKRKRIDTGIRLAISNFRQTCASNEEAGDRLGISGKHVGQILKGEVDSIRSSTWEGMEPILRPLLANGSKEINLSLETVHSSGLEKLAAANNQTVEDYVKTLVMDDLERAEKYRNL